MQNLKLAGCEMVYHPEYDEYSYRIKSYQDILNLSKALNIKPVRELSQEEQTDFNEYCKAWNQGTAWLELDNEKKIKLFYEF